MVRDERVSDPPFFDHVLQHAVDERDVAARVHREERVREPCAEEGAVRDRGDPISLQPRFPHGIHDRDLRALLLRVVQVLRRHGLVVRHVGAEEDDQVAPDPIRVRAGGRRDTDRVLQAGRARRMARSARVVDVIRAEEPRDLVRDVVGFVRHPARRDEERDPVGRGGPNAPGGDAEGLVPGDPMEAWIASTTEHRIGQTTEGAQVFRRHGPQPPYVFQDSGVEGSHRVQREEIQPDRAQMDALHGEVAHPGGPERASVADAIAEDPPGEQGIPFVLPGGPHDLPVVMRLREAESERDAAHPLCGHPSPPRRHDAPEAATAYHTFLRLYRE